jgi:hypothetical protein
MTPMTEPRVVVTNREHLWWLLGEAAQLEHMIMCQYLFAEFSLKDGTDEGLTSSQAEAVERWRKTLRSIAIEEMLHLALVANLMSGIGAAPTIGRPNFPQRSGYFPSAVQLDLLPLGEEALLHFLFLERPEGMERSDAAGFVPVAPPREALDEHEAFPHGQEFATVGHLYRGIADGLRFLSGKFGENAVFVGTGRGQARPELFHWPQLIAVTDLASGLAAVEEIIVQGEGASGDWNHAHYGRFLSVWEEFQELRRQDPSFEPARPVIPAFLRQPFDIADPAAAIITDSVAREAAELANLAYEVTLHMLLRFFSPTDETDEQIGILVNSALRLMAGVLRPLATTLTTLPVGVAHPDRTVGFAFEMYYPMGNMVPSREPAWALLAERTKVLVDRCAESSVTEPAIAAAGTAAQGVWTALAAHVPPALRPTSP